MINYLCNLSRVAYSQVLQQSDSRRNKVSRFAKEFFGSSTCNHGKPIQKLCSQKGLKDPFRSDMENRIQKLYGFKDIVWLGKLGGLSSINYEIRANKRSFVLKKYRSSRVKDILKIERVSNFLSENCLPVLPAILNKEKRAHFRFDDELFGIFPKTEGIVLHEPSFSEPTLALTASLLSKLHRLNPSSLGLSSLDRRVVSKKLIEAEADKTLCLVREKSLGLKVDRLTQKLIEKKIEAITNLFSIDLFQPYLRSGQLVHGDFHNENLLFDKNHRDIVRLLDFEEVHLGHRVEDVIHFTMLACCNSGYGEENLRKARFFVQKYNSRFPLRAEEIFFGVHFELYKEFSSFFLERELYDKRDPFLIKFLERDLNKVFYFNNNLNKFIEDLCQ